MAIDFSSIDPVAFSLGPVVIRWYALAYVTGILLGWRYALWLVKGRSDKPDSGHIDDFVSWAIVGIMLGGRLGYVLFYNFDFYASNPLHILRLWEGGMSFHGGMIGVLCAMVLFSHYKKIDFLRLSDIVVAAAPIGLFFGRIANFINAELYGRVTSVPWAVVFPDGTGLPRHPSQLYEAFFEGLCLFLVLFALMKVPRIRENPGFISGLFLIEYGVFRILIEFVRQPDEQLGFVFGSFTMGQLLSLPMMVVGVVAIGFSVMNMRKKCEAA